MDVDEKSRHQPPGTFLARGSVRAGKAGKLAAPKRGSISAPREMFAAQRYTGPARRGAGRLHKPSNAGALKRRAYEQG